MSQHWSLYHDLFKILKHFDAVFSLCKWDLLSDKINKRFDYFKEVLNESTVEVSKVYKVLNLFKIDRFYSVQNCFNLLRIHTQFFVWHNDTEKDCLRDIKFTFLYIDLQISFTETVKNSLNVNSVLLSSLTVDQNVVQIDLTEVIEKVSQSIINVLLKGAQSVDQLKQ